MPTADWAPALSDVGAVLRARTTDTNGAQVGSFTVNTRPTGQQVQDLIDQFAVPNVAAVTGEVPAAAWEAARSAAAINAAMYVELSYFPEQINSGRSPYPQLKEMYDQMLARLTAIVAEEGGDVPGEDVAGPTLDPHYAFDVVSGDHHIIGRRTAW